MNISRLASYVAMLPEIFDLVISLAEEAQKRGVVLDELRELQAQLNDLPDVDEED